MVIVHYIGAGRNLGFVHIGVGSRVQKHLHALAITLRHGFEQWSTIKSPAILQLQMESADGKKHEECCRDHRKVYSVFELLQIFNTLDQSFLQREFLRLANPISPF